MSSTDHVYGSVTFYIEPVSDTLFSRSPKAVVDIIHDQYSVFPNPSTGILYVKYSGPLKQNSVEYFVSDMYGRRVTQLQKSSLNSNELLELRVDFLPSGVYFVSVNDDTGEKVFRFIKG